METKDRVTVGFSISIGAKASPMAKKWGSKTARVLPDGPTKGALRALKAAEEMMAQTDPGIWFDSWHNDLRDNDFDGKTDEGVELMTKESDGLHNKRTYAAKVSVDPTFPTAHQPEFLLLSINVIYRVCIDVPIEAYTTAKVPIPTIRRIPDFFKQLKAMPGWKVWDGGAKPERLMDGDIIAANRQAQHHAGILQTGWAWDSIINLPGPTAQIKYGFYRPSGRNDIRNVAFSIFEAFKGIDVYARWIREE